MKELWAEHKLLVLGFLGALMLTSVLFVRLIADVVYWPQHQDETISGWMTIGYVAHSYDVDKDDLIEALGIEDDLRRHLTLKAIADAQDISLAELQRTLLKSVTNQRATRD
ncbi:hypothetical protein A9Q96_13165 [Rhodobacterales bacterium 52_120_T64]|nr:hypothetical protein A9Q96_13165 [Rhodobacterales bacterium 52_120_T64]